MSLSEYGLEEYIRDTNDAFEKGIPSNYGEQAGLSGGLEVPLTTPKLTRNTVKKWAVYQGYYYDTTHQTRRHLDARRITLQNSGGTAVVARVWTHPKSKLNATTILVKPGQVLTLGINLRDEPTQYVDLIDPVSRETIGITREIPSDAADLVLREGHNGWWVQTFKQNLF